VLVIVALVVVAGMVLKVPKACRSLNE
jgi:hypothetical protein